jgi:hypothetical protein
MLKKIILAGATASVIAVSGLAAMTGTAAAAPIYPQQYDNGYQGGYQGGYHNGPNGNQAYDQDWYRHRDRDRDCRPVIRTVKWYDRFGFPHWRTVKVAARCDFRGPYPRPYWGH